MSKSKRKLKPIGEIPELKLDLGCGQNKSAGFTGVDLYAPDADVTLDLFKFPWPWKDESVTEIICSHFIEHIPQALRWRFFEEAWRILKTEAVMKIVVPNWKSERAYGDMTHQWPPVTTMFFFYLSRQWRETNKLTYGPYAIKANFECEAGPIQLTPSFATRSQDAQVFACTHYLESYADMWVTIRKKGM